MSEERGKVIEFKPRQKKKLKDPKYIDPAKKELLKNREKEKKLREVRSRRFKNLGIFILVCFVVYIIKMFF